MDDKKTPTVQLYSVAEGGLAEYELSVAENGEIIATYGDTFLKFPAGLTKAQLQKAFEAHNSANEGKVGLTEEEQEAAGQAVANSQALIDSL